MKPMMMFLSRIIFSTCVIILIIYKSSFSQLTAHFPDSNYYYNETRYERGSDMTDYNVIEYSIYYKKDTIVNNITHQLIGLKFTIDNHAPNIPNINGDIEFALIRNDKTNKKVYIKGFYRNFSFNLSLDTVEKLLYDFDLKVGDIYKPYGNVFSADSIHVISIDTITDVNNIKRAVFTLDHPFIDNGYIIEGIGGLKGLLGFPFEFMSNIYQEGFNCMNIYDVSYHVNFAGAFSSIEILSNPCRFHVFTGLNSTKFQSIHLFPSLSSDYITIENDMDFIEYNLYNIYGDKLTLKSENNNGKTQIDIRNLNAGIYFINSTSNNITYTGKFIKQ